MKIMHIRNAADYRKANEMLASLEQVWQWTKDAQTFNAMLALAEKVDQYELANSQPLTFTRSN